MKGSTLAALIAAALIFVTASFVAVGAGPGPLTYCGTVRTYQPPSSTTDGSIAIGSRTYVIVRGTSPHSALAPGADQGLRCIAGELDAAGRFIRLDSAHPYGAVGGTGVTYTICGTIADYRPSQSGQDGLLILHENGRETIVPAGTQLPLAPGASQGHRCFSGAVSAAGDAIVTGVATVVGPGGSPQPTPRSLPSTSTNTGWGVPFSALIGAGVLALLTVLWLGRLRRAR